MSSKIKSPNQKSNGFMWTLIAVVVIVAAVIGFIIYRGQTDKVEAAKEKLESVAMKIDTATDYIQLSGLTKNADAKTVDLYEDYSCPHCAELAEATDGFMKDEIEAGNLVVNIHPLNFLDSDSVKNSSNAGSAALAVAEQGDAGLYWNYRKLLFENQKSIYNSWDMNKFADAAKTLGADAATVKAIKDNAELEMFQKEAEANANKLKDTIGRVSSPQVIFDGKEVTLVDTSGSGFANWPKNVVEGKAVADDSDKK